MTGTLVTSFRYIRTGADSDSRLHPVNSPGYSRPGFTQADVSIIIIK